MNRQLKTALVLLSLVLAAGLPARAAEWQTPIKRPAVEVFYIPQEELARAPGYTEKGVMLPLTELLELASRAESKTAPSAKVNVTCTSLKLAGALKDGLALEGELAFDAAGEGWGAALIEDGAMPWTAQQVAGSPSEGRTPAFLARVSGRTWLYARAPGKGALRLRALVPVAAAAPQPSFSLGRFYAPCRIDVELGLALRLVSSDITTEEQATTAGARLTLWPSRERSGAVRLNRRVPLTAVAGLEAALERTIAVRGAGLEVSDQLTLRGRFAPQAELRLPLPKGMQLLRHETDAPVKLSATGGVLTVVAQKQLTAITVSAVFAADLQEGRALLSGWDFAAAHHADVRLAGSARYAAVLEELPAGLAAVPQAAGDSGKLSRYECWGPLPALHVSLAPAKPTAPVAVEAWVSVSRNEATAVYTVSELDPQRSELTFTAPAQWLLTDVSAVKDGKSLPCSIQEGESGRWRAAWAPRQAPQHVGVSFRRLGAWGEPESEASLELPLVAFDGPRPLRYELGVTWPEALEVRPVDLSALKIVATQETAPLAQRINFPAQQFSGNTMQFDSQALRQRAWMQHAGAVGLRVVGANPSGTLTIRGRGAVVKATVVTALSLLDDRAEVRALLDYQVRFAPVNRFRFMLPAGLPVGGGANVRVNGAGIRQSSFETTPDGELWTVLTQQNVGGNTAPGRFGLTLEWSLPFAPGDGPVAAPQILLPGISTQQGFVVLEGSETLYLNAETKNLAETSLLEVPTVPWPRKSRALAAYRYVQPPFSLSVSAEKFEAEPALAGLVREGRLTTSISAAGERFTQAVYTIAAAGGSQFVKVALPPKAQLWSALVNGHGVKPARRLEGERALLLIPLPERQASGRTAANAGADVNIAILYREQGPALTAGGKLRFDGPQLDMPVNHTSWNLNLPPDFEYLAFGGSMTETSSAHSPIVSYLRTASYPSKLAFPDASLSPIVIVSLLAAAFFLAVLHGRRRGHFRLKRDSRPPAHAPAAPPEPKAPPKAPRTRSGLWGILLVLLVFAILAAISVPNFLEFQTRAKSSRAKSDLRNLATAVEAYRVDNNANPDNAQVLWQGPVSYLSSGLSDPYAAAPGKFSKGYGRTDLRYLSGPEAFARAHRMGVDLTGQKPADFWMAYSIGPDGRDDGGMVIYDPTNGTTSAGDVIHLSTGPPQLLSFGPSYIQGWLPLVYDPTNGTTSEGDVVRWKDGASPDNAQILWQGPVSYLSSGLSDPYATAPGKFSKGYGRTDLRYLSGREAFERARRLGVDLRGQKPANFWMAYSIGPDGRDDGGTLVYDPTNGTTSAGDVIRLSTGRPTLSFGLASVQGGQVLIYDPTNGTTSEGDVVRWKDGASPDIPGISGIQPPRAIAPADKKHEEEKGRMGGDGAVTGAMPVSRPKQPPAPEEGARPEGKITVMGSDGTHVSEKDILIFGPGGAGRAVDGWYYRSSAAVLAQQAGLLSLDVEMPRGGFQRDFETLGGEARMEINLLDLQRYKRLHFLVWLAAFLALTSVWIRRRERYRQALIAAAALTLLAPLLFRGASVAFFNAAFQGVLLSLAAPAVTQLGRRFGLLPVKRALLLLLGAGLLASAGAQTAPAQQAQKAAVAEAKPQPAQPPRILAPYGELPPRTGPDVLGFMNQEDFTRLWNAAHRDALAPKTPRPPALAALQLEGALNPERKLIEGTLTVNGVNLADDPGAVALALPGLILKSAAPTTPGAVLEAGENGLMLRMAAHWSGVVKAEFALPCTVSGSTGEFATLLPEAAAGFWRVALPYPDATVRGLGTASHVTQRRDGQTLLQGAVRPGKLQLAWDATQAPPPAGAAADAGAWTADLRVDMAWSTLSHARWRAALQLRAAGARDLLPAEIRLTLDPGLSLVDVKGPRLLSAAVNGAELLLQLEPAANATIEFEGLAVADRAPADAPQVWTAPGLRLAAAGEMRTVLRLELSAGIEVLSIAPRSLERQAVRQSRKNFSVQEYRSTAPDWAARLELRRLAPAYDATLTELLLPANGFLRRAATVDLTPRSGALGECRIALPPGTRVLTLTGNQVSGWAQTGDALVVGFNPALTAQTRLRSDNIAASVAPVRLTLTGLSDLALTAGELTLPPLNVTGAANATRLLGVLTSIDEQLTELELAGAAPRSPRAEDHALAGLLERNAASAALSFRCYALAGPEALRFRLAPVAASARTTVYNRVTVAEGLQTLEAVVVAQPRRGRLEEVEALLLLPAPDAKAAARLQASGPVRAVRTTSVNERTLRVVAKLTAPQAAEVQVRFQLDWPQRTEHGDATTLTLMAPVDPTGGRAFVLLRRAFEGELIPAARRDARAVDAAAVKWPTQDFHVLPADRCYELSLKSNAAVAPAFNIVRHERQKALRAVVEVLRQLSVITEDGLERHELEIVLQNQSEQFLKVAFPYKKDEMRLYEVRVSERVVKATFGQEGGRDVLLVPLIRTGLLDPELTVRVAYTVEGRPPLKGGGAREQQLPEILGGVPVALSSLKLMLPPNFKYKKFEGSLNEVGLFDLEANEALRRTKNLEKLSEEAIYNPDYNVQKKALINLSKYQQKAQGQYDYAQRTHDQQERRGPSVAAGKGGKAQAQAKERFDERRDNLEQAQIALGNVDANFIRLEGQLKVQEQQQAGAQLTAQPAPAPAIEPEAPTAPPMTFPHVGDVFAFRQVQGTGAIHFKYASRDAAQRRYDWLAAAALIALVALLIYIGGYFFATWRRAAAAFAAACALAILLGTALDLAIPGLIFAIVLLIAFRRSASAQTGGSATR